MKQQISLISSSELFTFGSLHYFQDRFGNTSIYQRYNEEWNWIIKENMYPNETLAVHIPCYNRGS